MKLITSIFVSFVVIVAIGCSGMNARLGEWPVPGRTARHAAEQEAAANARQSGQTFRGYIAQDALTDCQHVAESFNVEDPMIPYTRQVVYDVPCLERHLSR